MIRLLIVLDSFLLVDCLLKCNFVFVHFLLLAPLGKSGDVAAIDLLAIYDQYIQGDVQMSDSESDYELSDYEDDLAACHVPVKKSSSERRRSSYAIPHLVNPSNRRKSMFEVSQFLKKFYEEEKMRSENEVEPLVGLPPNLDQLSVDGILDEIAKIQDEVSKLDEVRTKNIARNYELDLKKMVESLKVVISEKMQPESAPQPELGPNRIKTVELLETFKNKQSNVNEKLAKVREQIKDLNLLNSVV